MSKKLLPILLIPLIVWSLMSTANIRNLVSQIQTLAGQVISECDVLDTGNTPAPSMPTPVDCLAGTVPPATNMYADELNETAWLNKRASYRTLMKNSPSGSIVFIGDSMIERQDLSGVSSYAVNMGISGESIRQLAYRINENDIDNQPNLIHRAGAVVILTGVNDLSDSRNGSPTNAAETVEFVYNRLKGWLTGKVVICKLIPVDANVFSIPTNASIAHVNNWIDANFANLPNVRIVDVNATLAPNGTLLPQYHVDGQHLSPTGNQVLQNAIKAALQSLSVPI
jgi:lysophospholipase L1-like esterase